MIKVLQSGHDKFQTSCERCACQFVYELSDIKHKYVQCPECGFHTTHRLLHNVLSLSEYNKIMNEYFDVKNHPLSDM